MASDFTWPEPPKRLMAVFCSVCNVYLGIHDVDRMQHEHFDHSDRCRQGFYDVGVYEQSHFGNYAEALRAMAEDGPRMVPCDDAAVERAEAAAEKLLKTYTTMMSVPVVAEQIVEAVLKAAAGQETS